MKLIIPNASREEFIKKLTAINDGEYIVEFINKTNEKVAIKKPGSKGRDDFLVYIVKNDGTKWQISHNELFEDIDKKCKDSSENCQKTIRSLRDVCDGVEPSEAISKNQPSSPIGIEIETLLKVYKWIWGQEDCNYPYGEGRWLSMNEILKRYNIVD